MNHKNLGEVVYLHSLWLAWDPKGKRADLRGADLSGADLRGADLRGADLSGADLRGADLSYADLSHADLRGADLSYADLSHADLSYADLRGSALRGAALPYYGYRDLQEVVALVPLTLSCLDIYGYEVTCRRLAPGFVQRDSRAVMFPSFDFAGAFCFVPARMEIWWWAGYCPDPETTTVLWKAE